MLVNLTIPVYNEEVALARSIPILHSFLSTNCRFNWEIVIIDNGSTDRTLQIANDISRTYTSVYVMHIDAKGRGIALKTVWQQRTADVYSYMDVDLSTELTAFPLMIEALLLKEADICVGSRLIRSNTTKRSFKRAFISRIYNFLVKAAFQTSFSDAQCGFKAVTSNFVRTVLPNVYHHSWFFDTELLVIAEKGGFRIADLPVCWNENFDSRVNIWQTIVEDIRGILKLRNRLKHGRISSVMDYDK